MTYQVYHYPLSPACRVVRLALFEKGIEHKLIFENPANFRLEFRRLNPFGTVPVAVTSQDAVICGEDAIINYINEVHGTGLDLFGQDPLFRAEVRRILSWMHDLFEPEVIRCLVDEKTKPIAQCEPDSQMLRAGRKNLKRHLEYLDWLCDHRSYLADKRFSVADLTVAAYLSVVDYLGEISWAQYPNLKNWYAPIKSRPSFKSLLRDRIPGYSPPEYYTDLDF